MTGAWRSCWKAAVRMAFLTGAAPLWDSRGSDIGSEVVDVFFNVFGNTTLPVDIVAEQLGTLANTSFRGSLKINYVTLGEAWSPEAINRSGLNCATCRHLEHRRVGSEEVTLNFLYEHCVRHPTARVAYIHSKGSFHPKGNKNAIARRFLTNSVASRECLGLAAGCTTCSGRFTPFPHPHNAGNMWTARCSYIKDLGPPVGFQAAMESFVSQHKGAAPYRYRPYVGYLFGTGRWSMEHWPTSHPNLVPCDVYPGKYVHGYVLDQRARTNQWSPNLHVGARFPLKAYLYRRGNPVFKFIPVFIETGGLPKWLAWRRLEWRSLYGAEPRNFSLILGSDELLPNAGLV